MEKRERIVRYITGDVIILLGIGFIFFPRGMMSLCFRLIGLALIVCAVILAVNFYDGDRKQKDFLLLLAGLAAGACGFFLLFHPRWVLLLVDLIIGFILLGAGIFMVLSEIGQAVPRNRKWVFELLIGGGIAIIGALIIFFPVLFENYLLRLAGVLLIYSAADGIRRTLKRDYLE